MWILFCSQHDHAALWAHRELTRRGLNPFELVTAESLICSLAWEHRIDDERVAASAELADGRSIDSHSALGVVNRIAAVPQGHLSLAKGADRDYALEEFSALMLSWLNSFPCPVLNSPDPRGLCGAFRPRAEWMVLAAAAGLPVPRWRQRSDQEEDQGADEPGWVHAPQSHTAFVVGDRVVGAFPNDLGVGCQALARTCGLALMGVDFQVSSSGSWTFQGATPLPDLRRGAAALIDGLYDVLGGS